MSRSAIILSVVGIAVLGVVGYTIVKNKQKGPPVSGAAFGPASGSGVQIGKSYGSKVTNTANNILGVADKGLDIFGKLKSQKIWG